MMRGTLQLLARHQHLPYASPALAACPQLLLRSLQQQPCATHTTAASGSSSSSRSGAVALAAGALGLWGTSAMTQAEAQPAPAAAAQDAYKRPTELHGLPKHITLYQYEVCPFCCKVKAALDYYKLPYEVVEVNPLTKSELKWSTYKKVPVMKTDEGDIVCDSTVIMSRLAAEVEATQKAGSPTSSSWLKGKGAAPGSSAEVEEEEKWRKWVDERLVKVITANIYRSWDESWETFRYVTQMTNWAWGVREAARVTGAVLMWQVGKKMPAKYGITGDLREALYRDCNELVDSMGGSPFLGGAKPNLADLAAFGVLRAVEYTPTFKDAMAHSRIAPWFLRMSATVGPSSRVEQRPSAQQ